MAKSIKEIRAERDEARYHAAILAQAYTTGKRPPAYIVTTALEYPIRASNGMESGLLFGDIVLVHRGNNQRTEGPGRGRWVRMRLVGVRGSDCDCQLIEDDPDDTVGIDRAGARGTWPSSVVVKDKPVTGF